MGNVPSQPAHPPRAFLPPPPPIPTRPVHLAATKRKAHLPLKGAGSAGDTKRIKVSEDDDDDDDIQDVTEIQSLKETIDKKTLKIKRQADEITHFHVTLKKHKNEKKTLIDRLDQLSTTLEEKSLQLDHVAKLKESFQAENVRLKKEMETLKADHARPQQQHGNGVALKSNNENVRPQQQQTMGVANKFNSMNVRPQQQHTTGVAHKSNNKASENVRPQQQTGAMADQPQNV